MVSRRLFLPSITFKNELSRLESHPKVLDRRFCLYCRALFHVIAISKIVIYSVARNSLVHIMRLSILDNADRLRAGGIFHYLQFLLR